MKTSFERIVLHRDTVSAFLKGEAVAPPRRIVPDRDTVSAALIFRVAPLAHGNEGMRGALRGEMLQSIVAESSLISCDHVAG